jgi:hypothetical protein
MATMRGLRSATIKQQPLYRKGAYHCAAGRGDFAIGMGRVVTKSDSESHFQRSVASGRDQEESTYQVLSM